MLLLFVLSGDNTLQHHNVVKVLIVVGCSALTTPEI